MGKDNHDPIVWLGLVILILVMLVFIFFTQYQTGFLRTSQLFFKELEGRRHRPATFATEHN